METVFKISNPAELNDKFLKVLKMLFQDKAIEISIREDIDETDYLMHEPANRYYLRNEIKNLNEETNLIKIPGNDYDELVKNLLRK